MPQRAQASNAVSSGWLSCASRVFKASSMVSVMLASLYRLRVRKYRTSPEEFAKENTREEEIQTVADLSQRDIDECDRADDIHRDDERIIDNSQTCHRYKERCQPDGKMIVWQAQAPQVMFCDSHDSTRCAQGRTDAQHPKQD